MPPSGRSIVVLPSGEAASGSAVPASGMTGGVPLHSLSGSCPAGTGAHRPTLPATLHASQVPLHALSQHTPSTQSVDVHSVPAAHGTPRSLPLAGGPASDVTGGSSPGSSPTQATKTQEATPAAMARAPTRRARRVDEIMILEVGEGEG